jgi:hypothetical protein
VSLAPAQTSRRRDELLAAMRAGVDPSSPAYPWTYGERQPDRDYFSLWIHYDGPARSDVRFIAHHTSMELERRFRVMYGAHHPGCLWAYQPPVGVEVRTDEPEGWQGWRPELKEPAS